MGNLKPCVQFNLSLEAFGQQNVANVNNNNRSLINTIYYRIFSVYSSSFDDETIYIDYVTEFPIKGLTYIRTSNRTFLTFAEVHRTNDMRPF